MRQIAKRLLLPPAFPFLIMLVGAAGAGSGADPHGAILLSGAVLLYLCSIPYVGRNLLALLPRLMPGDGKDPGRQPDSIVVLSGDLKPAPGSALPDLGELSVERVRHAARLHRQTGLPILVSGGAAEPMAAALSEEFGVTVRWVEGRSRRTLENAEFSAGMLRADDIGSAWVVTQDWHMPRALAAFRRTGLGTRPAPASTSLPAPFSLAGLIPSPAGGTACHFALHELLGLLHQRLSTGS